MSLYPGWGVGGRIKLAGWSRKLVPSKEDDTIKVTFDCERDSVERFGSFRSMDILRLWMATGLDTVATEFYKEIDAMSNNRDARAVRLETEAKFKSRLESLLSGADSADTDGKQKEYLLFKPVDSGIQVDSDLFSIYKFDSKSKNMTMFRSDLLEAQVEDIAGSLTLEPPSKKRMTQNHHYGFNDNTGIRRWMVNAGMRLYKREIGEAELASAAFDAVPENYEIMRNDISLRTMRSQFEDTIVTAIAGLVVPADPQLTSKRRYVIKTYVDLGEQATRYVPRVPPTLKLGIGRDGLVPLQRYIDNSLQNKGSYVFSAPFSRTLSFRLLQRQSESLTRHHFRPGDEYESSVHDRRELIATKTDENGNITKTKQYVRMSGIPLHANQQHFSASYIAENNENLTLHTFSKRADCESVVDRLEMTWSKVAIEGVDIMPYALQCDGKFVVELEIGALTGYFAPIPLQVMEPTHTKLVLKSSAQLQEGNSISMDTSDDSAHTEIQNSDYLMTAYDKSFGAGVTYNSFNSLLRERLIAYIAGYTEWENDEFNIFARKGVIYKYGFDEGDHNRKLYLPGNQERNYADPTYKSSRLTRDDFLGILGMYRSEWFAVLKNVVTKTHFNVTRYRTSDKPLLFMPYDNRNDRILYELDELPQMGYEYVKSNQFQEVAFCEELYRPAADHAANPDSEYSEDNERMKTTIKRPNGYASAPQDDNTSKFMAQVRNAAAEKAKSVFTEDTVYELVPLGESAQMRVSEKHPDTELIEMHAPGDNAPFGWAMGGTPMALVDALELGVAYLDSLEGS